MLCGGRVGEEDHFRQKKHHVQKPCGTMNWMHSGNCTEMSGAGMEGDSNGGSGHTLQGHVEEFSIS